jgi:hypothetical protein
MSKNQKNKIMFKVAVPKIFLREKMFSSHDMEKNLGEISITAIDLKTGAKIGKYSTLEYRLKFL